MLKRTFVRQFTADGCGPACIAMLLNYSGRPMEAAEIARLSVPDGGLSLRKMQDLAASVGLSSRCVELDMQYLKTLNTPIILHTLNDLGQHHFQVCYGYNKTCRGNKFLIADPAIQLHQVSENELANIWVSKAALYFENLDYKATNKPALIDLLQHRHYPLGLLFTVPLLSLCIAIFGVALTWLLQKGFNNSIFFTGHIIYFLVLLLFIISVFKNLFSFLRQYIVVQINMNTNSTLMQQFVRKMGPNGAKRQGGAGEDIKAGFLNVQRMQNAISSFIAVILSDGCMVITLLASSFYILPVAGLINLAYILIVVFWELRSLPELIYQTHKAKLLSDASESALISQVQSGEAASVEDNSPVDFKLFYRQNLEFAKRLAIKILRTILYQEFLGTCTLILIITITVFRYQSQQLDYESLMLLVIETYLTTVLMQRICATFQQVAEGADAAIAQDRE